MPLKTGAHKPPMKKKPDRKYKFSDTLGMVAATCHLAPCPKIKEFFQIQKQNKRYKDIKDIYIYIQTDSL